MGIPHSDSEIQCIAAKAESKVRCHRCEARDKPVYVALNLPKWPDCCTDPSAAQIGVRAVLECVDCAVMGTMELMLQDRDCFESLEGYERDPDTHSYAKYSVAFYVSGDFGGMPGGLSRCLDMMQYQNALNDSFPLGDREWRDANG